MRKNNGFTLIELLLYVGIMAIVLTAIIPFGINVVLSGVKNETQAEVYSNTRFISEKIKYTIRSATALTSVSGSTLVLGPTTIDLLNGKVRINGINLNSNDTTVSGLVFTNYSSLDNKTKNVNFVLTIKALSSSTRQEYQASASAEGDAEIRSN